MTESYLDSSKWCPLCDHKFYNAKGIKEELREHFADHHGRQELEQALINLITSLITHSHSRSDIDETLLRSLMERARTITIDQILAENKIVN